MWDRVALPAAEITSTTVGTALPGGAGVGGGVAPAGASVTEGGGPSVAVPGAVSAAAGAAAAAAGSTAALLPKRLSRNPRFCGFAAATTVAMATNVEEAMLVTRILGHRG